MSRKVTVDAPARRVIGRKVLVLPQGGEALVTIYNDPKYERIIRRGQDGPVRVRPAVGRNTGLMPVLD